MVAAEDGAARVAGAADAVAGLFRSCNGCAVIGRCKEVANQRRLISQHMSRCPRTTSEKKGTDDDTVTEQVCTDWLALLYLVVAKIGCLMCTSTRSDSLGSKKILSKI